MKALVADRSATTRRVVIRALRVVGIGDVHEFGDAKSAVEAIAADTELVVLEWGVEDDATLDLVTQLRAPEKPSTVKVIVLSERDHRADIERMAAIGIQGYVLKPFEARVLIEQIAGALRGGEATAEAA